MSTEPPEPVIRLQLCRTEEAGPTAMESPAMSVCESSPNLLSRPRWISRLDPQAVQFLTPRQITDVPTLGINFDDQSVLILSGSEDVNLARSRFKLRSRDGTLFRRYSCL